MVTGKLTGQAAGLAPARVLASDFIKLPQGGYGEFGGDKFDGMEAGAIFDPVNFWGGVQGG